jgi:Regulator of chromosome condensation (RCC1) repeat
MTLEGTQSRGRARGLTWRLAVGASAAVAALAIPALPAAGAATMPHGGASAGPDAAAANAGTLRGWGFNGDGELGNGTTDSSDVPVKVKLPSGTKITQVRQGCDFTVALTSAGSVLTWGDNSSATVLPAAPIPFRSRSACRPAPRLPRSGPAAITPSP